MASRKRQYPGGYNDFAGPSTSAGPGGYSGYSDAPQQHAPQPPAAAPADPKILDQNSSFATKTALAFKNAYADQTPSILLDMFIYFRNTDNNIVYKSASSALLNMTSDTFASINSNIAGLPIELNPEAIDKVLAYIHGDALIFPKPLTDTSIVQKTFIAAAYFKQVELANKLRQYAKEQLRMHFEFDNMNEYATQQLPPPLFLQQFPDNLDQLPMVGAPQGRQPPPQQQHQGGWRQQNQPVTY